MSSVIGRGVVVQYTPLLLQSSAWPKLESAKDWLARVNTYGRFSAIIRIEEVLELSLKEL